MPAFSFLDRKPPNTSLFGPMRDVTIKLIGNSNREAAPQGPTWDKSVAQSPRILDLTGSASLQSIFTKGFPK